MASISQIGRKILEPGYKDYHNDSGLIRQVILLHVNVILAIEGVVLTESIAYSLYGQTVF